MSSALAVFRRAFVWRALGVRCPPDTSGQRFGLCPNPRHELGNLWIRERLKEISRQPIRINNPSAMELTNEQSKRFMQNHVLAH